MLLSLKLKLLRFLQDHRRNSLVRRISSVARTINCGIENPGYDFETNGEAGVLRSLQGRNLNVILDIGANHGDWTKLARRFHSGATVHLFELAAPTFTILQSEMSGFSNVHLHGVGIGRQSGPVSYQFYPGYDHLTTTVWQHDQAAETLTGEIRRGDEWAIANRVTNVDFLKVDVEGMELDVLSSFGALLETAAIRFIQFEHQGGRAMLRDFYSLLTPRGYRIGKIYSRYVDFCDYRGDLEHIAGPNYLAVRSDETQAITDLHRGWSNPSRRNSS